MPKQQRGNDYLVPRLEKEHPAIYADWKAGKYRSASEALVAAGLKRRPTALNALRSAWRKASGGERSVFLNEIRAPTSPAPSPAASLPPIPAHSAASLTPSTASWLPVVDSEHRLTPEAVKRIDQIMSRRQLKMGDVMAEMGFKRLDGSLGTAMRRPSCLRPVLASKLEKWLERNKTVM